MKNLYSCLLILFFLVSCTNDTEPNINAPDHAQGTASDFSDISNRAGDLYPANSDNPYDNAGKLHNEIFSAYYESDHLSTNLWVIASRVNTAANSTPGFDAIMTPNSRTVQVSKVQEILAHPNTCIGDIIAETSMSAHGKSSLNAFVVTALILMPKELEYKILYDFVCKYEGDVIADPLFTAKDRKVILTTTSIVRYSLYKPRKRPKKNTDPDWNIFIANIAGGIYGAEYDMAESIMTALTAGIKQNQ